MLGPIDYVILIVYTLFVLGIGFALKRYMKTSTDFFLSGRSIPAWITALAFVSANLGAHRSDRHGGLRCQVRHDDLPFLLAGGGGGDGLRGRVHDALLLRLEGPLRARVPQAPLRRKDPRTQRHLLRRDDGLSVGHFHVCPGEAACNCCSSWDFNVSVWVSAVVVLVYIFSRRADLGHLQRSAAVLPDRAGFPAAGRSWDCTTSAAGRG